ncbi:MAG: N-6 DNA methylase [Bacteroidetes bacterium]|nr:N-6 DNA methylase [Bacteroidota bacterium]
MTRTAFKEYLVKEDLIDTIISLPEGLLQNSSIPLIVMVLNKAKEMPRKVRFVDARKFVVAKGLRGKVLNDQKLLNLLKGNKNTNISDTESMANEPMLEYNSINRDQNTISDYERLVDKSQIVEFDYNLNILDIFKIKLKV